MMFPVSPSLPKMLMSTSGTAGRADRVSIGGAAAELAKQQQQVENSNKK